LALLAVCWPLNWSLPGNRTAYLFFPLWLGYILVVDALVLSRTGTSLWTRSRWGFALLFVTSVPAWWLFEAINRRTANWEYLGSAAFTDFEYYLLCTISFSTVMPAVFETAELARSFRWMARLAAGPRLQPTPALTLGMFLSGAAMLALTLAWPRVCYPFVWTSLVFGAVRAKEPPLAPLAGNANGWRGVMESELEGSFSTPHSTTPTLHSPFVIPIPLASALW
jgi:hypothetical protein